jgi:hypothetical protein
MYVFFNDDWLSGRNWALYRKADQDNEGDVLQYSILSLSRIRIVKDRFFLFDFVNYNVLFNI